MRCCPGLVKLQHVMWPLRWLNTVNLDLNWWVVTFWLYIYMCTGYWCFLIIWTPIASYGAYYGRENLLKCFHYVKQQCLYPSGVDWLHEAWTVQWCILVVFRYFPECIAEGASHVLFLQSPKVKLLISIRKDSCWMCLLACAWNYSPTCSASSFAS